MPCAVGSSFDVAIWFMERADSQGKRVTPLRLQRLLFLAQAYFAAASGGNMLMPSVFVSHPQGPIDPNLFRVSEMCFSALETDPLPPPVSRFLNGIWDTFGQQSDGRLDGLVLNAMPVREAMDQGPNIEIELVTLFEYFSAVNRENRVVQTERTSSATPIPRFHKGRPVKKWMPRKQAPTA